MIPKNPTYYNKLMQKISTYLPKKVQPLFLHPAGPTTVFFWAPSIKWCLVLAGIGDVNRSPDKISLSQTFSLFITGLIWSRYSLVIIPINYYLFSVNAFISVVNLYSLGRGIKYNYIDEKVK